MAASNPYTERVIQLQQLIAAKEQQIGDTRNSETSWYQRAQSFLAAGQGNGPEYAESMAMAQQRSREAASMDAELVTLRRQLEQALKAEADIDAAAATAVANGLSPEAAIAKASADHERAQGTKRLLTYVGLGLLVLIVVAAVVYWRRKRKG
jgi:hypothetical protein